MSQQPKTDFEAYNNLKASKESGLAFYFEAYYEPLSCYAYKIVSDEATAQEMAAEAFLRLWQMRDKIESDKTVKSLLYRLTHNEAIDYLRAQQVARKRQKAYLYTAPKSETSFIEIGYEALAETETYRRLFILLKTLSPRTQEVFQLFYYQNKSIKQIAFQLGISVNTVKTIKLRAVRELKAVKLTATLLIVLASFSF